MLLDAWRPPRGRRGTPVSTSRHLTVVGFDDSPLAQRTNPPLTTVRQDAAGKGRVTAAALVDALDRRRAGRPQQVEHIVLPTELVVRSSSAAPKAP